MDENNNRNFLLAIVLSGLVLLLWQMFYATPQMEKQRQKRDALAKIEAARKSKAVRKLGVGADSAPTSQAANTKAKSAGKAGDTDASLPLSVPKGGAPATPGLAAGSADVSTPAVPGALATKGVERSVVLAKSPRYQIDTPSLSGSIALMGGRIDDLVLRKYRVKVDKDADEVEFFSPSGSEHPLYAEYGWLAAGGSALKLPGPNTLWKAQGSGALTPQNPVTLVYDNGQGLVFSRTISIDDHYMFEVRQSVRNNSSKPVTLYPYALISRHEMPKVQGFYILHEGLLGVLGEEGLQEIKYKDILEEKSKSFTGTTGWIGLTDKYWGTAIVPGQNLRYEAHFSGRQNGASTKFQADYQLGAVTIPAGGSGIVEGHLFAGAKKVKLIDEYAQKYNIKQFDLLIDWGWFHFITKPMFAALHFFYGLFGNFGVAILIVTGLIKLLLFPLASKSYESMSKMKKLQPEMNRIRERFGDDKVRQQQEMMALYQKGGANPLAGCLPILIQIPVFFSLYKVLFVTLEMRHAPFFGWIQDLSAPDPTSLWNLFGLLPFAAPHFLSVGIWPLLMGITMWIQMKLNPQQGDPTQQMIFNWMPVVFTFLLATFPAGLVIYWAWNNTLSVIQQWYIMHKNGVEVDLLENTGIRKLLDKKSAKS